MITLNRNTVDIIFGAVLILVYWSDRFNTPRTNRSSTTAALYYFSNSVYCLIGLGFYGLLLWCPHFLNFFAQSSTVPADDWTKSLSSPLAIAVLLTIFISKLPLLSDLDLRLRKALQNMAAIPSEARHTKSDLSKAVYTVPETYMSEVASFMDKQGFQPAVISFEPGADPRYLWTKINAFLAQIETFKNERKAAAFLENYAEQYALLQKHYLDLNAKAKTYFKFVLGTSTTPLTKESQKAFLYYEKDFIHACENLEDELLDFIARCVLKCEFTAASRQARFEDMGFKLKPSTRGFSFNQILSIFGFVGILLLCSSVIIHGRLRSMDFGQLFLQAMMISIIYTSAVAWAVYPKKSWKMAIPKSKQERPVEFYFVAGILAAVTSLVISFIFHFMYEADLQKAWTGIAMRYPWALMSFSTAFAMAFLTDNESKGDTRWHGLSQRVIEGLILGCVLVLAATLTILWLKDVANAGPRFDTLLPMSGVVGFLLGYCIPTWYRESLLANASPPQDIKKPDEAPEVETTF